MLVEPEHLVKQIFLDGGTNRQVSIFIQKCRRNSEGQLALLLKCTDVSFNFIFVEAMKNGRK